MKSPIEDSPEHLLLIGIIAARWATLDLILTDLLKEIIGRRDFAELIYFSTSSQRLRFDQILALLDQSDIPPPEKATLEGAIKDLAELWKQRNDILHTAAIKQYRQNAGSRYFARVMKPVRKNAVKEVEFSAEFLQSHADKLSRSGGVIWDWVNRWALEALYKFPELQSSPNILDEPT